MARLTKRELRQGPGMVSVIVGAILSAILGVVLGVACLVLTPVAWVERVPEVKEPGVVYFVEQKGTPSMRSQWRQSAAALRAGVAGTYVFKSAELNTLLKDYYEKVRPRDDEEAGTFAIVPDEPQVTIDDGALVVALPGSVLLFGIEHELMLQGRGAFARRGDRVVFEFAELTLNSLRVPVEYGLRDRLVAHFAEAVAAPAEVTEGWAGIAAVTVDKEAVTVVVP